MSNVKLYNCAKWVHGEPDYLGKVFVTGVPLFAARAAVHNAAESYANSIPLEYRVDICRDSHDCRAVTVYTQDGSAVAGVSYWIEEVQA